MLLWNYSPVVPLLNGVITTNDSAEFKTVLRENPLLYDIFAKHTLGGLEEAKRAFNKTKKKYGKATQRLNMGHLQVGVLTWNYQNPRSPYVFWSYHRMCTGVTFKNNEAKENPESYRWSSFEN